MTTDIWTFSLIWTGPIKIRITVRLNQITHVLSQFYLLILFQELYIRWHNKMLLIKASDMLCCVQLQKTPNDCIFETNTDWQNIFRLTDNNVSRLEILSGAIGCNQARYERNQHISDNILVQVYTTVPTYMRVYIGRHVFYSLYRESMWIIYI